MNELLENRDPVYLARLFDEINPYLIRVCVANGVYAENVNDLVHQTWERFFTNLAAFEGRSEIQTFVCGILINKIREYRRYIKRMVPEEDPEQFLNDAFTTDGWWKTPPSDPHRILELKQASEFVKECLEGLSGQQVSAFLMREVEEEAPEEICNTLGVSASHLRVLLFRAKEKLRRCLEGKVSAEQVMK